MGKLSEIQLDKLLILLWGPPLGGKTVFASQFPQPFFIDLEDGLHSVKSMRREQNLNFDFDAVVINDNETTDEDFIKLCGERFAKTSSWIKAKKLASVLCQKMPKDSTLVFDNLSRGYEMLLAHIKNITGRSKLQLQDWGTFVDEMSELVNMLKYKAKCNVIAIGHEEYNKDEASGEVRRKFLMVTKMRERIPSIATEFWRIYSEPKGPKSNRKVIRHLQTMSDFITDVGSRSCVPDMENPTYTKVKPYLEGALGRKMLDATWTPAEV